VKAGLDNEALIDILSAGQYFQGSSTDNEQMPVPGSIGVKLERT